MRFFRPPPAGLSDKEKAERWKQEMERRVEVIEAKVRVITRRVDAAHPPEEQEDRNESD